jgi:hypothetical protein
MQNTTFPCTSLKHFSDLFSADNPNITDLIASCPQKCALAWGTGNPDISGIGVFISYCQQLGLSIILGPGHIVLYRLSFNNDIRQYLSSVYLIALTTTVLFASPIAIASIVYLQGQPALFEIIFIYYLNVMEFLSSLILYIGFWIGREDKNAKYKPVNQREQITFVLGGLLHCGLFGGVMYWIGRASRGKASVVEFISACKAVETTVPIPPVQTLPLVLDSDRIVLHENEILNRFLIFLCFAAAAVGFYFCCKWLTTWSDVLNKISSPSIKRFCMRVTTFDPVCTLVATGLAVGMAYCFAKMHIARQQLASVAHDEFTDDEWGFGQVVALFVWVPLMVEISVALGVALGVKGILEGLKKKKKEDEEELDSVL